MAGASDLKRALIIGLGVAVVAVAGLVLAEAFDVDILIDPDDAMATPGPGAALLGVALLVADVVLPVPSSLVMIAHGALFGMVGGAALNLLGRTGSAVAGVLLGRVLGLGGSHDEGGRAYRLVERWGLAAVVLTRPVPVLAESTVVAAGACGLSMPKVVAAAALGSVPEALVYALAGAATLSYGRGAMVFGAVVCLSAAVALAAPQWKADPSGCGATPRQ